MTPVIYIPGDSGALALGADKVAKAIASRTQCARQGGEHRAQRLARRLSPGADGRDQTDKGRIAYGPVKPTDVPVAVRCRFPRWRPPQALAGRTGRVSRSSPSRRGLLSRAAASAIRYRSTTIAGMAGWPACEGRRDDASRHRQGRSPNPACADAAAPASRRASNGRRCWIRRATANTSSATPMRATSATFADRMIMEGDPFVLIEGMAIAGIATGATKGFVYIRSEYPHAVATMREAIEIARAAGVLGVDVLGSRMPSIWKSAWCGRLCLRRGNLAAEQPGRQARRGARQAAAAGNPGPVRPADGDQQCHLAGFGADHPRQGRGLL